MEDLDLIPTNLSTDSADDEGGAIQEGRHLKSTNYSSGRSRQSKQAWDESDDSTLLDDDMVVLKYRLQAQQRLVLVCRI